ncbi:unnamed protein product [Brassica oleracea]
MTTHAVISQLLELIMLTCGVNYPSGSSILILKLISFPTTICLWVFNHLVLNYHLVLNF